MKTIKQKILKFVLPFFLDSYASVIDKLLNDGKLKHPAGWSKSRDYSIILSNLIKKS